MADETDIKKEEVENAEDSANVDADGTGLELSELETEEDAKDVDMVRVGDSGGSPAEPKPEIEIPDLPESPQDLEAVYDVPVQVSAVLGKATMQVNQLLKLGRGAVVELDRKVGEAIDIYVNNRLVARGEVVVVEERLGVTMTEIIKTERT